MGVTRVSDVTERLSSSDKPFNPISLRKNHVVLVGSKGMHFFVVQNMCLTIYSIGKISNHLYLLNCQLI